MNDRNEELECVAQATLHDSDYDDVDTVSIEDETDLTEQIIQDRTKKMKRIKLDFDKFLYFRYLEHYNQALRSMF